MRHYIARWLRRAANRLDPIPVTDDTSERIARILDMAAGTHPVAGFAVCPRCGATFYGYHACWTIGRDGTSTPLPWPGSTWTVKTSNGASA